MANRRARRHDAAPPAPAYALEDDALEIEDDMIDDMERVEIEPVDEGDPEFVPLLEEVRESYCGPLEMPLFDVAPVPPDSAEPPLPVASSSAVSPGTADPHNLFHRQ